MKKYIELRCRMLAEYVYKRKSTVREAALKFGVSKSTVHKDVTTRLKQIDYALYLSVKEVLDLNLKERHVRGGNATKARYLKLKNTANGKKQKD